MWPCARFTMFVFLFFFFFNDTATTEIYTLSLHDALPISIKLHNPTFFKAAYSDDFHGISRYGEIVNKQGIVRELETMALEFDSVISSDAQIRMFRDAAYVLSLRSEVGHMNGKKFYNQFRILRVYVNTPRGWRIVSQLETKLVTDVNR